MEEEGGGREHAVDKTAHDQSRNICVLQAPYPFPEVVFTNQRFWFGGALADVIFVSYLIHCSMEPFLSLI